VIDLGCIIGHVVGDGRDATAILSALTPKGFYRRIVDREVWRVLATTPDLEEGVIRELCDSLLIDPDRWPDPWPSVDFEPFPEAWEFLMRLSRRGKIVALTNQSVTAKPAMERVMKDFGAYISKLYPSYGLGAVKPAQWLWRNVADDQGCKTSDIIHIGNRLTEDVLAPLSVGARAAVWVRAGTAEVDDPRCLRVQTLTEAVDAIDRLLNSNAT